MIIFIILYFIGQMISNFYIDYEWFKSYNKLNVFWTLFLTKFNVQGAFSLIFVGIFFLNFLLIKALAGKGRIFTRNILDRLHIPVLGTPKRALFLVLAISVVIIGFFMGMGASVYWKEYLMYSHAAPFSNFPSDPIFNKDLGFYVFSLPFYKFLLHWLMVSLVMITAFSFLFHILNAGIFNENGKIEFSLFARAHLSTLFASIVFIHGIGYRISAYDLLFSQRGKFYGAGYTAVHAQLTAYNICMIISFIAVALLLFNIFRRSFRFPVIVLLSLIPVYFLLGTIYPSIQQRFYVEPSELDKESAYIKNNIQFTRLSYGIDKVSEKQFANKGNLTYKDIIKNKNTLQNIRLWDWRPLKQTYKQLQELKPYYQFNDVDIDRYMIDNEKIAVNLSARELATAKLSSQSKTWINQHLVYTHGYGLVLSRVDKITPEGLPEMLIYDIPPKTKMPAGIKRPEIYYGEHENSYVITGTSISPGEFDYPYGDINKYTKYDGKGGVELNSLFKRLLFELAFNDINILISGNVSNKSKVLYRRNIMEMVRSLTPFLEFDDDPYLVMSAGRLYWIIDGYTTSDKLPYSTPIKAFDDTINYIRNSVKVIIDAYDGTMNYYICDENDPIIKTYSKIFEGLFQKFTDIPADLQKHIRYPETLFNIQCRTLLRYHMTNVNVFYNNEDLWGIPRQIFENVEESINSYYLVTTLPGEKRSEFVLIMPFTPAKKDNMIGFLVAYCDQPSYGELKLFALPKEKLSYGPMQIEARINQDTEISKLLTLWSQKGSKVIKGNMLAIPIEESLIFIEPLYLKAESSEMPELKQVIVSYADKVVMEANLLASLDKLFQQGSYMGVSLSFEINKEGRLKEYAQKAYQHYIQSEKYLRDGNWSRYGEEIVKLKQVLEIMKDLK